MSKGWSRWLALAGLLGLAGMILARSTQTGVIGVVPLCLLLLTGLKPLPWWAVATALFMLPYFSYGIMDILTDPAQRGAAAILSGLTILVFLAALDTQRRG